MKLDGFDKVKDVSVKSVMLKGQEITPSAEFNFSTPAEFMALMEKNSLGSKFVGVKSIDVVDNQVIFKNILGEKG